MYTQLKKLIFSLIILARKLCSCFQARTVVVLTDQPLKMALHRLDTMGKVAKWALKLTEFDFVL